MQEERVIRAVDGYVEAVLREIDAMTSAELAAVFRFAAALLRKSYTSIPDPGDLVHDAIVSMVTGREWRPDVKVADQIMGAIQSIYSHTARSQSVQRRVPFASVPEPTVVETPDIERILRLVAKIRTACGDDAHEMAILDGLERDLKPARIRALNGISKSDYKAAMMRIQRKAWALKGGFNVDE